VDNDKKNISDIVINKDCYKTLKKLSVDKEVTLQKVVQEILERYTNKKTKQSETEELS